ncbi:MAG: MBL fold metallo-hydrolase [bacterium]
MSNSSGLYIDILGDYSTFSTAGKGIGYRIRADGASFLLDCGAPVFHQLGDEGINNLDGIIITHSHEDHKRWLTEIGLHNRYISTNGKSLPLLGIEKVLEEIETTAAYALEQTLSEDSSQIENIPFNNFFQPEITGPRPRYRCKKFEDRGWRVVDEDNNILPPDKAKVFIVPGNRPPRMLFKDPEEKIWVEPESFYDFTDERFYKDTENFAYKHKNGLKITPVKATFWHGLPGSSYLFSYEGERVLFSSDTHYNPELWKELASPLSPVKNPAEDKIAHKYQSTGDINNYIQQTWSKKRLERALNFYNGDIPLVHDVTTDGGVVHTPYKHLQKFEGELLLTHTPDNFTALDPLCSPGQVFKLKDDKFLQVTGKKAYQIPGDCFSRNNEEFFIGIRDNSSSFVLVKNDTGNYQIFAEEESIPSTAEKIYNLKLYREINGDYYPVLKDGNKKYALNEAEEVVLVEENASKLKGKIITGKRQELLEDNN